MLGQDAINTAKAFNERLPSRASSSTKIDSDSRSSATLPCATSPASPSSSSAAAKAHGLRRVRPQGIRVAHPRRGRRRRPRRDVQRSIDTAQAQKFAEKLTKGDRFDLNDMKAQLVQVSGMGSFSSMLENSSAVPAGRPRGERRRRSPPDPHYPSHHRLDDAAGASSSRNHQGEPQAAHARGAGVPVQEVNRLLKQYEQMSDVMKRA